MTEKTRDNTDRVDAERDEPRGHMADSRHDRRLSPEQIGVAVMTAAILIGGGLAALAALFGR